MPLEFYVASLHIPFSWQYMDNECATRIEFDGDCYTITDRKTNEPLFVAIPEWN